MPGPDGEACVECHFFAFLSEDPLPHGFCRRYPPVWTQAADDEKDDNCASWKIPEQHENEWCGEFKAMKK